MKCRVARRKAPPVAMPDFKWLLEPVDPGAAGMVDVGVTAGLPFRRG